MAVKSYKCSQPLLYSISRKAWASCGQNLPHFTKFKAKYTPEFIAQMLADIAAAEALPEFETRDINWEKNQTDLVTNGKKCLQLWQDLKRYIADSWPRTDEKKIFEEAGQDWYKTAKNKNWEHINNLNTQGIAFMRKHRERLLENNNMPTSFPTTYLSAIQKFDSLYRQFARSWDKEKETTEKKILANNATHRQLMLMMVDGQRLFKAQPEQAKQFVFMHLLAQEKNH